MLLGKPAGQGAFAGYRLIGMGSAEADADVAGTPVGVLLTQGQGLDAERIGGPAGSPGTGAVGGLQLARVVAEAAKQVLHRAQGQVQARGQLERREASAGELPQALSQRQRKGDWHGEPRKRVRAFLVTIDRPPGNAKPFWLD